MHAPLCFYDTKKMITQGNKIEVSTIIPMGIVEQFLSLPFVLLGTPQFS